MKAKRLISLAIAALLLVMTAVSVSAATLTDQDPGGQTEVKAHIDGNPIPGNVSYIITIPDVVDFGLLTQPETDTDDYKDVDYTVEATKIEGLDAATKQVSVYVKDLNARVDVNQLFKIANKSDPRIEFEYDVYRSTTTIDATTQVNENNFTGTVGYFLYGFTAQGQQVNGTLRLNQRQLYSYDIKDIIGDYSGYMVFYSAVEDQ